MSYPYHMRLWDKLQRRAADNARRNAQRAYLEKMRAPVAAAAPDMSAARLAKAKQSASQLPLL